MLVLQWTRKSLGEWKEEKIRREVQSRVEDRGNELIEIIFYKLNICSE